MNLSNYIREKKDEKKILVMTHQVIGYPDLETNRKAIELFSKNDIDLLELQIPFSDPVADGPTFAKANQLALSKGISVSECFEFIEENTRKYSIPILIMTYYNIIYQYGIEKFIKKAREINVKGLIIPDASIDEAEELYSTAKENGLSPVTIATPNSDDRRLKIIAEKGDGFIYYVPRKGVTGYKTNFTEEMIQRINHVKKVTGKNIAVGFGIQNKGDIDAIKGTADIAIIGSKITRIIEEEGLEKLDIFLKSIK